jgi:hypothetical protein
MEEATRENVSVWYGFSLVAAGIVAGIVLV